MMLTQMLLEMRMVLLKLRLASARQRMTVSRERVLTVGIQDLIGCSQTLIQGETMNMVTRPTLAFLHLVMILVIRHGSWTNLFHSQK